ncbi:uncharacterized protein LOC110114731 [Dendrobium catenatum]|uniref:uncharacterized protein LOC110114731 n=1 Tax=Dendrobium catenatum TaxID=906689 RepID=UPI0010A0B5DF|nr:uncharacterized protein LOC110114731 [Dendrobium catenatum]
MISKTDVGRIIGNSWDFFHQPAVGTVGGIMIMWDGNLTSFTVIEHTSQVVFGALTTPNKGLWHVAMVYGHKDFQVRRDLWNCLDKVMMSDVPTIVGGDFNCLLSTEDKRGGKRFKMTKGTEEMKSFMLKDELQNDIIKLKLQEDEAGGLSPEDLDTLCSNVKEYNVTLVRLSTWWNQRAKAKWNEDGDTNSRFYHTYSTARKNDKWKPRSCNIQNWPEIEHNQKLDTADIDCLNSGFSETEFFNVVSQLGSNKSPGLDGSTSSFFKFYWDIIKDTTWRAINHFFTTGRMNGAWKDTLIVLIPKINNLVTPSNFLPICLCQTIYKIATSIIVNILKIFIPKLITEEQVTYVPGRSMSDHCLLALEICNKFRISKNKKGLMAIKLDMAQAFDSMCWKTLENVLHWFGFPGSFSNLILECVTGVRFSILLNGKGTRWIEAKSGFRQGYPMSPYLFIMFSQLLSSLIQQRGLQICIQTSNRAPRITHLLYANDVLLFGKASDSQLRVMMNLIKEYCGWTGKGVNQSKSQIIFGSSTNQSLKRKIGKKTGFKIVKEFHYFGIKIALRRLAKNYYQFVINHALNKLNSWGARFLSMAGRLILAKSSLLSLPTFVSTHSLITKKILYDLDRICRDFIWHQNKDNKGLRYIALDDLCTPRNRGGLGMHSSVKRVGLLRARLAWRFYQNPSSLLFKCLTAKQASNIWNGKSKQGQSAARSIISNGVSFLKPIIRWKISNGANINMMDDIWLFDKNFNKWPMLADCIGLENLTLQNFLTDGHWNYIELNRYFNPYLVNLIVTHCIIQNDDNGSMELLYQHSGKSITSLAYAEVIKFQNTFEDHGFAIWLRKLKLKPRVELFLWRLSRFSIPTNEFLKYRRLTTNDLCAYGCLDIETSEHILIHCKSLTEILNKLIAWGFYIPLFISLEDCFQQLKILSCKRSDTVRLYGTAVYYSWNRRNDKKHCNPVSPVSVIAANNTAAGQDTEKLYFLHDFNKYLLDVKSKVDALATAGAPVEVENVIHYTLNGLPNTYQALKTAIRTNLRSVSLDEIYALLCSKELNLLHETTKELHSLSITSNQTALTSNRG